MKKMIPFGLAIVTTALQVSAAGLCFKEGDNVIGAGLNLDFGKGIGLTAAYDRGAINNMFSFGGELNLSFDNYDKESSVMTEFDPTSNSMRYYKYKYEYHDTYFSPQFRFGFHPFGLPGLKGDVAVADKIDPYAFAHTGPKFGTWRSEYIDQNGNNITNKGSETHMAFGIGAGIRWMFKKNIGMWGEIDWDRFIVGACYKF